MEPIPLRPEWDLRRVESISDGVFLVAMTLPLGVEPGLPRTATDLGAEPVLGDILQKVPSVYGVADGFFVTAAGLHGTSGRDGRWALEDFAGRW